MAPELTDEGYDPEAGSPESLLRFLSEHRESTQRRRERKRPSGRPGRRVALLLGTVVALAVVVVVGAVLWGRSSHPAAGSTTHLAPTKAVHPAAGAPKASKAAKEAAPPTRSEPWHSGLHPYREPGKQGLPNLYYVWMRSHFTCAGNASHGCWKAKIVTRRACPRGIAVLVDEMRGGVKVGTTVGYSRPVKARTQAVVEVDADQQGVIGQVGWMACN